MSTAKINNIEIDGSTTNLLETSLRTTFVKTFPSYVFINKKGNILQASNLLKKITTIIVFTRCYR